MVAQNKFELNLKDFFDVRTRIDKGMVKLTFIQYFIYVIISGTFGALAGVNLL